MKFRKCRGDNYLIKIIKKVSSTEVLPRSQLIDRASLDRATLDQLKKEARSYGLPVTGNRAEIIDLIMSHLERHGPTDMVKEEASQRTRAEPPRAAGAMCSSEPLTAEVFRATMLQMQQQLMLQQQQFMTQIIQQLTRRDEVLSEISGGATAGINRVEKAGPTERASVQQRSPLVTENGVRSVDGFTSVSATKWLATQIPEFGGSDSENVQVWIRRVDRVAQIHGATDDVILVAASSKLTKFAKQWYELQDGSVIESWGDLKRELVKIFERRVPFYKAMQKIEARRWNPAKETFDQYSLAKLSLMQQLNLPVKDTIHLIIGGITSSAMRATALSAVVLGCVVKARITLRHCVEVGRSCRVDNVSGREQKTR